MSIYFSNNGFDEATIKWIRFAKLYHILGDLNF